MKNLSILVVITWLATVGTQADNATNKVVKPYPIDHCILCGMLVKGRANAYTFVYQGQEIRLCSKSERQEFERTPAKYLKKIADAEAKLKK